MNLNKAFVSSIDHSDKKWVVIDAEKQIIGRLATQVAIILLGKNKATYSPSNAPGDKVIIINADKAVFSGTKMDDKLYRKYTGYRGNDQEFTAREAVKKHPGFLIEQAVKRMLPKNILGGQILKECFKVYAGNQHPHSAQMPAQVLIQQRAKVIA